MFWCLGCGRVGYRKNVCPVPRPLPHLHTQAESGAYLRDSSRFQRWCPLIYCKALSLSARAIPLRVFGFVPAMKV